MVPGQVFLAVLLPTYIPKQPFPSTWLGQLSQQGQEEKTSDQLQAERAGWPGCSPVPSLARRYLHRELAPGTSSPAAAAAHMCRFMWRARWSEREKARSQRWHWNGRCPVCLR